MDEEYPSGEVFGEKERVLPRRALSRGIGSCGVTCNRSNEVRRLCDDVMKFQTRHLLALFGNVEDDVSAKFYFHIGVRFTKIKNRETGLKNQNKI